MGGKVELFSLKSLSSDEKMLLIRGLGFDTDGVYVLDKEGNKVLDKYIQIPIKLDRMLIFPGSTIILDDNDVSINLYLEEYGDIF